MKETSWQERYGADKIFLLGLFTAGLLIAWLVSSSRYAGPLQAGRALVAEARRHGLAAYLARTGDQAYFLITDKRRRTIGFALEISGSELEDPNFTMELAGLVYFGDGALLRRQLTHFQSDDSFDNFQWRIATAGLSGASTVEISRGADGIVTVSRSGRRKARFQYTSTAGTIPAYLLDLVLDRFVEHDVPKAIVEAIDSEGQMAEVVVTRTDGRQPRFVEGQVKAVLDVEFLDQRRLAQTVYLDVQGRICRLEQQGMNFERTTEEAILSHFPEWRDYILEKKQLLEEHL